MAVDRRMLLVEGLPVHVPVNDVVRAIIARHFREHAAELNLHLEPHGLTANDIQLPLFERLVFEDEVRRG
jgi:hypothetical protein